jgi:hypothetical protein
VDDSAFCSLVDCGKQRVQIGRLRIGGARIFSQSSKTRNNLAISQSATLCLTGAFGGGFAVSHIVGVDAAVPRALCQTTTESAIQSDAIAREAQRRCTFRDPPRLLRTSNGVRPALFHRLIRSLKAIDHPRFGNIW